MIDADRKDRFLDNAVNAIAQLHNVVTIVTTMLSTCDMASRPSRIGAP